MELLNYLINFLMLPNDGFVLKTNGKKFGVRGTQSVPNLICFCMSSWPSWPLYLTRRVVALGIK